MIEVLGAQIPDFEAECETDSTETRVNTKTKIITAGALGALGLAASYAETHGWVRGWPPPAHSLRHPWIGYYAAWSADKIKRRSTRTAIAAGLVGNTVVESAQDVLNRPDGSPFHWADVPHQSAHENLDNLVDLVCCMGGTALFLAQNNQLFDWGRHQLTQARSRLARKDRLAPVIEPE